MNEKYVIGDLLVSTLVSILTGFTVGLIVGNNSGQDTIKCDAIKNHAAIWTSDENGSVKFEWIKK